MQGACLLVVVIKLKLEGSEECRKVMVMPIGQISVLSQKTWLEDSIKFSSLMFVCVLATITDGLRTSNF